VSRSLIILLATCVVSAPCALTAQAATPQGASQTAPRAAAPTASTSPTAQPSFEIRGKVVDTANAPLPRASVSLRPKGSTVTIAGALANTDGTFRVTGLRPGTFTIRVVSMGYAPVIQDVTLAPNTPVLDLGIAKLAPVATLLNAVTVKEERATVVTEPDRTAYRAKDVAPGAANASELLENVPSVQVDVDGKVSLRGNENVVVQINGRPTPMRGQQLASYLKSLPANTIDRIEVIPNPSAKYDPDGMAGIINVALKANVDLGLSGAVNANASTAERWNGSGNLGYQVGKWSSFVSGGLNSDERTALGINNRERYDATNALLGVTGQSLTMSPTSSGQNLNATVDYKLTPRDVLSNALQLNHRESGELSMSGYTIRDGAGGSLDSYLRPRNTDASGYMIDYDIALKRTLAPRTHEMSTEFRYNYAHDEDVSDQRRLVTASATNALPYIDGRIDRNDALTRTFTGQADYLRAFRPRTKLETGVKSNVRWFDRDFAVTTDASGTGTWTPSTLSNALEFNEAVHAVYAVMSQGVAKWDLQAGLRGEYADRTFTLGNTTYPFTYRSLFPSAVAVYNATASTQLKSSYSRRVRRPGSQELNPFPTFFDADNIFLGNPNLSPEYTDALEFALTRSGKKGMLQLSPFYRHTSNVIRIDINTTDTLAGREVTSISFRNLATSDSYGSDLTGQLKLSPRFSMLSNFSLFKMVTDGGSTSAVGSDALAWMGRVNITSELTRTFTVQAAYNYRAPMKIERGTFGAQHGANLSLRKKVNSDKAAVVLRVNDPFATMRFRIRTGDDKVMQLTERNPGARMVFLGYQYNFGRPPRMRQVSPDQTGGGSVGFGGPPGA
jgi:outer membrane receptor protein involved in Fe transport